MLSRFYSVCALAVLMSISAGTFLVAEDWVAPASAAAIPNPAADDPKARAEGGSLYATYCASCHGAGGKGDGISGMYLSPRPTNFTEPRLWNESDGALFWKLTNGRKAMPSYKVTFSESQRWKLIAFLRTFAAKPATRSDAADNQSRQGEGSTSKPTP
jgi:mono/diheme cytochrome c family protein